MKPINRICAVAGLALVLGASTSQASFDNNVYNSAQNSSALVSQQQSDSPDNGGNRSAAARSSYPGHNQVVTPNALVPEPTTLIAGVLLLIPFAVSTVRIMRRSQPVQVK